MAVPARIYVVDFESLSSKEAEAEAQGLYLRTPSDKLAGIQDRFKLWENAFGGRNGYLDRTMHDSRHVVEFVTQILQRSNEVLQEGLAETRRPYGTRLQEILVEIQSIVNCL